MGVSGQGERSLSPKTQTNDNDNAIRKTIYETEVSPLPPRYLCRGLQLLLLPNVGGSPPSQRLGDVALRISQMPHRGRVPPLLQRVDKFKPQLLRKVYRVQPYRH